MCVVAAKYFEDKGWVLIKNRDRKYKPIIRLRKSFRNEVERLYMWDDVTKYSEGINEFGVAVISSSVEVKEDESEGKTIKSKTNDKDIAKKDKSVQTSPRTYYNPDGLRIRKALFEKTVYNVTKKLIELEIPGNTIIADRKTCFILEAAFDKNAKGEDEYVYKVKEVPTDYIVVRTNHGILLPWTGYSKDLDIHKDSRLSSDKRFEKVLKAVDKAKTPDEMLDACSDISDKNPQLNPVRIDTTKNAMRTTGQIIIVPKEMTLYYRPIWCETLFDIDGLNKAEEKTFFEIISNRKLLKLKDILEVHEFKDFCQNINNRDFLEIKDPEDERI